MTKQDQQYYGDILSEAFKQLAGLHQTLYDEQSYTIMPRLHKALYQIAMARLEIAQAWPHDYK